MRIPHTELVWRFSRAGGPGGQGVNTTDSRVELIFNVATSAAFTPDQRAQLLHRLGERQAGGIVTIVATEHRSQLHNRQAARARLAAILREALTPDPPARRPTRPTQAAQQRRLAGKRRRSQLKQLRAKPPWDLTEGEVRAGL